MRFPFKGNWFDAQGAVIASATITVYLANGTTLATVYESETGSALSGSKTTTNSNGFFEFWVSDGDYSTTQLFRVIGIKEAFADLDLDDIPIVLSRADTTETLTNKTLTSPILTTPQINDTSKDHQYIIAVSELTADRTITLPLLTGNVTFAFIDFAQAWTALQSFNQGKIRFGDTSDDHYYILGVSELAANRTITLPLLAGNDIFVFNDFAATLANKTLTTPVIASFTNATHDHSNAAGGGNLGQASATDLTITGLSATPPDANTLTKDLMIGARCTFNGTGTPAYLAEVNFSGAITDNGTGDYTLLIDRDFADANYSASIEVMGVAGWGSQANGCVKAVTVPLVGSIRIVTGNAADGSLLDFAWVSIILVGDQ